MINNITPSVSILFAITLLPYDNPIVSCLFIRRRMSVPSMAAATVPTQQSFLKSLIWPIFERPKQFTWPIIGHSELEGQQPGLRSLLLRCTAILALTHSSHTNVEIVPLHTSHTREHTSRIKEFDFCSERIYVESFGRSVDRSLRFINMYTFVILCRLH
mmetsp:Transcript_2625/g.4042  ORF Transcript_2625/g.4042 Transcript_2625/m.4042 type:complete len:159 (+) Transcript_2625:529-1005(+)